MSKNLRKALAERMPKSAAMHERAMKSLVNFYTTGPFGFPQHILYVDKCAGSRLFDIDGNEYIDYCMGIGPLILGHSHPVITEAAVKAVQEGTVHAMGHEMEVRLAELVCETTPGAEGATFVNSGTEATLHAIKMSRAKTGKDMIAKFEGAYHGVHDYAQVSGRSMIEGPPEAPVSSTVFGGIPKEVLDNVLTLSYNYSESLDRIRQNADKLAAVIVEPVPTVCPIDFSDFLRELRKVTEECGIILIFDEVLSGYRMALGGAQEYFGIQADLVTYGKIIGGGFPAGAIAGSREFLSAIISSGDTRKDVKNKVAITGTFSGNPVTCAGGVATLEYLKANKDTLYPRLESVAKRIREEIVSYADEVGFPLQFLGISSWLQPNFSKKEIRFVRDVDYRKNSAQFELLRRFMLVNGIVLGDVPVIFPSAVHSDEDVGRFIEVFKAWIKDRL